MNRRSRIMFFGMLMGPTFLFADSKKKTDDDYFILKAICTGEPATIVRGNEKRLGCSECPSFTPNAGAKEPFYIDSSFSGAFTAPNTDEKLLMMFGCGQFRRDHDWMILVRKTPTGWAQLSRESFTYFQCLSFKKNSGEDTLVCERGNSGAGGHMGWVEQIIIDSATMSGAYTLLETSSNHGFCHNGWLNSVAVSKMRKIDVNKDGKPDLQLTVEANRSKSIDCKPPTGFKPDLFTLNFEFDGKSFSTSSETKKLIKHLDSYYETGPE